MLNRKIHVRLSVIAKQAGAVCNALSRTASRMIYQSAYALAIVFGGESPRRKKLIAARFALNAQENAQKSAPAAISIFLNAFIIWIISILAISPRFEQQKNEISIVISDGFFTKEEQPPPPADGGGNSAMEQTIAEATKAITIPTVQHTTMPDMASITTALPTAFEAPSFASPQINHEALANAIASIPSTNGEVTVDSGGGSGTGTGTGTGTGSGTENGIDGGSGNGQGSGNGARIGSLYIEGEKIGVIHDTSGSMGNRQREIQSALREQNAKKVTFSSLPHTALFLGQSPWNVETMGEFGNTRRYLRVFEEVVRKDVTTILLVTDLQDGQDNLFMDELRRLIITKGIRLHLLSVRGCPIPSLIHIIRDSGGSYEWQGHHINVNEFLPHIEPLYPPLRAQRPSSNDYYAIHRAFVSGEFDKIEAVYAKLRQEEAEEEDRRKMREERRKQRWRELGVLSPEERQAIIASAEDPASVNIQGQEALLLPNGEISWPQGFQNEQSMQNIRTETMNPQGVIETSNEDVRGKSSQGAGQNYGGSWKLSPTGDVEITLPNGEIIYPDR